MTKKKSKNVVGIDPSLTGLAAYRSSGCYEMGSTKFGDGVHARRRRLDSLIEPLIEWLQEEPPDIIVIEAYFAQQRATALRLIELGWQLRHELSWQFHEAAIYEVTPATMKKIITGSGNASKTQVSTTLATAHGVVLASDNVADALGLLQMGRMIAGEIKTPKEHAKSLKKILEASI